MKPRALISVSDKTGVLELARGLVDRGWEILSTGGTARTLREQGIPVVEVAHVTGHPEMMDGRVKTLHPAIHAGILARREHPEDMAALEAHGYSPIDLVAVNLYPFRETAARGVDVAEVLEQIDIGGPAVLRSAAKNHPHVWVVVDHVDYAAILDVLDGKGDATALRRRLAAKVFRHTSDYDAAIADHLERALLSDEISRPDPFPPRLEVRARRIQVLRYGENPDQGAAFYALGEEPEGVAGMLQLHGKELSYNNLLDLDGALLSLAPFAFSPQAAVCLVKHTTPCGLALAGSLAEAYRKALATDPVSAFGSVIAANRFVDGGAAQAISELFVECLAAPGYTPQALEMLTKKKNLRILQFPMVAPFQGETNRGEDWEKLPPEVRPACRFLALYGQRPGPRMIRSVYGGLLVQDSPDPPFHGPWPEDWKVVTRRVPTVEERRDLSFAWAAVFGVKSNAVLLARNEATVGIGAGQMSRVDSVRIALQKARDAGLSLEGAVLASDAFFPFRDGVDAAAAAGIRAVVQPGGSVRDEEVVAAADEQGLAMVFTGRRLFRH